MSNDILPPCFAQYTSPRRSVMAPKEKKEAKEKKSKAGAAEPAAEAPAAAASPAAAGGSVDMAELARLKDQVAQMESQLNKQAIKNHSENAVTAKFDVLKQYLQATVTSRKDVIKQQMRHVKVRMEEVQAVRRETTDGQQFCPTTVVTASM